MADAQSAKDVLATLLEKLGLQTVNIHEELDAERKHLALSVFLSEEESRLFHLDLQEIRALERILGLILRRQGLDSSVEIDIGGQRALRDEKLRALTRAAAREVTRIGKPVTLHSMSGRERRVVHLELVSHPEVRTESVGEGEGRRVVIYPLEHGGPSGPPDEASRS